MDKPKAIRSDPDARRAYARWHYQQNKPVYKARARAKTIQTRSDVRALILNYLKLHPCLDCGEVDPIVLEFDHRDGSIKDFNLGEAVRTGYSCKSVLAEIEKCDVRCANCHRRATYRRAGRTHRGDIPGSNPAPATKFS